MYKVPAPIWNRWRKEELETKSGEKRLRWPGPAYRECSHLRHVPTSNGAGTCRARSKIEYAPASTIRTSVDVRHTFASLCRVRQRGYDRAEKRPQDCRVEHDGRRRQGPLRDG